MTQRDFMFNESGMPMYSSMPQGRPSPDYLAQGSAPRLPEQVGTASGMTSQASTFLGEQSAPLQGRYSSPGAQLQHGRYVADARPSGQGEYLDLPPSYGETWQSPSSSRMHSQSTRPVAQHSQKQSVPGLNSGTGLQDPHELGDRTDDADLARALEFTKHAAPARMSQAPRLNTVVAIPQLVPGAGSPFARAYAPILAELGIPVRDFMSFVDNLNIISSGTPPLRIIGMTGGLLSLVPWHYSQLLALGVQAAAKAGNQLYASARGDRFMEGVNRDFFAPKGLKVEIATGEAVAEILHLDPRALLDTPRDSVHDLTGPKARVAALQERIQPLTFEVPPPDKPSNALDQLSARVQAHKAKKTESKAQEKAAKEATKQLDRTSSSESSSSSNSSSDDNDSLYEKTERVRIKRDDLETRRDDDLAQVQIKHDKESKRAKETAKIWEKFEKDAERLDEKARTLQRRMDKKISHRSEDKQKSKQKNVTKESKKDKGKKASKKEKKELKQVLQLQWILVDNL